MLACPTCGRHYHDADFVPGMRVRCACGRWLEVPDHPSERAGGHAEPGADRGGDAAEPDLAALAAGVRVHRCPSCGASVPGDGTACPYCRSTLLTRPCPACFAGNFQDAVHCVSCGEALAPPLVAARGASGACPRCGPGWRLHAAVRADVTVWVCGRCTGVFAPHRDLDALSSGAAHWPLAAAPGARVFQEARVRYLRCPFCDTTMDRRGLGRRRVVVDVCRTHGVWFDMGELTRFLGDVRTSLSRAAAADDGAADSAAPPSPAPSAAPALGGADPDAPDPATLAAIVDRLVQVIEGANGGPAPASRP